MANASSHTQTTQYPPNTHPIQNECIEKLRKAILATIKSPSTPDNTTPHQALLFFTQATRRLVIVTKKAERRPRGSTKGRKKFVPRHRENVCHVAISRSRPLSTPMQSGPSESRARGSFEPPSKLQPRGSRASGREKSFSKTASGANEPRRIKGRVGKSAISRIAGCARGE